MRFIGDFTSCSGQFTTPERGLIAFASFPAGDVILLIRKPQRSILYRFLPLASALQAFAAVRDSKKKADKRKQPRLYSPLDIGVFRGLYGCVIHIPEGAEKNSWEAEFDVC